MEIGSGRWVSP